MTATFVTPKTCPKCSGSGDYHRASGHIDVCNRCWGVGTIETNRAVLKAEREAREARDAVAHKVFVLAQSDRSTGYMAGMASDAMDLLRRTEPARYAKALVSLEAGRTDLIKALAEYWKAQPFEVRYPS